MSSLFFVFFYIFAAGWRDFIFFIQSRSAQSVEPGLEGEGGRGKEGKGKRRKRDEGRGT